MPEPRPIYLVPHTHWDREWYRPFQSFRIGLVDLIDRVLDEMERDPEFSFTLDGQLVTIDDYLEIRPDAGERIRRHVASGRLAIGPWLVLMDEFLVSGETMVRNLEAGTARAADFGGAMPVGYLPDMFGHVAQMPQLLRRAGLRDAVVWRGVPSAVTAHAFAWEAPDGSRVRAEYLPAGYGNAAHLFDAPDQLAGAVAALREEMQPWFGNDPVLAMYGADHAMPDAQIGPLLATLNRDGAEVRVATLGRYLAETAGPPEDAAAWTGEMRSGARANVLMGVNSAHIDIKQAAGRAERLLERYAEPLTALHLPAAAWPAAYLQLAWRRVIENSAHDSICGCSVDAVTHQVLARFAEAEQVADALTARVGATLAAVTGRPGAAVLNPSPLRRSGMVELEVGVPHEWQRVALELPDGRRVATQEVWHKEPGLFSATLRGADADDLFRRFHGREVFDHQWNAFSIAHDASGRPALTLEVDVDPDPAWLDVAAMRAEVLREMRDDPNREWQVRVVARPRRRVLAAVPAPALGWTALRAVEAGSDDGSIEHPVRAAGGSGLDNGLIRIEPAEDGSLRLTTADGTTAAGLGKLVDGGDYGDSYNYGPPAEDQLVERAAAVSLALLEHGPVRGRLRIERVYHWPIGVEPDGGRRTRASVETRTITDVELRAGEPFARVTVSFENRSDDHRVRAHLPLPRPAQHSDAEGQFAVVRRGTSAEGGYREHPLPTFPARGWVDAGGLAVLLDHVIEYELVDVEGGHARELALTVLRSTGLISRNDNPYRQDPAGPEIAVPATQMRGPWSISFGLLPHAGDWLSGGVPAAAELYAHDLRAATCHGPATGWPPPGAGEDALRLEGEGVVLTSLRRRGEGWIEARLVNLAADPREAVLGGSWTAAREADLLGRPGPDVALGEEGLRLTLGPAEIRTIQLRRHAGSLREVATPDAAKSRI